MLEFFFNFEKFARFSKFDKNLISKNLTYLQQARLPHQQNRCKTEEENFFHKFRYTFSSMAPGFQFQYHTSGQCCNGNENNDTQVKNACQKNLPHP